MSLYTLGRRPADHRLRGRLGAGHAAGLPGESPREPLPQKPGRHLRPGHRGNAHRDDPVCLVLRYGDLKALPCQSVQPVSRQGDGPEGPPAFDNDHWHLQIKSGIVLSHNMVRKQGRFPYCCRRRNRVNGKPGDHFADQRTATRSPNRPGWSILKCDESKITSLFRLF